jgi:hypothetical protein
VGLGHHWAHIGCHWTSLGIRGITCGELGSILVGLGSSLASFWSHLGSFWVPWVSFWMPRASKMDPMSNQANIAKTYENLRFWLILEGWRVTNAASGSLRKLGGALGLASGWMAAGLDATGGH